MAFPFNFFHVLLCSLTSIFIFALLIGEPTLPFNLLCLQLQYESLFGAQLLLNLIKVRLLVLQLISHCLLHDGHALTLVLGRLDQLAPHHERSLELRLGRLA